MFEPEHAQIAASSADCGVNLLKLCGWIFALKMSQCFYAIAGLGGNTPTEVGNLNIPSSSGFCEKVWKTISGGTLLRFAQNCRRFRRLYRERTEGEYNQR